MKDSEIVAWPLGKGYIRIVAISREVGPSSALAGRG